MYPCALFFGFWWIFPIIMIAMMTFCFFMMRRNGICRIGCCTTGKHHLIDETSGRYSTCIPSKAGSVQSNEGTELSDRI